MSVADPADTPRSARRGLQPWRPATVAQEIVTHAMLLLLGWLGGLGYLGTLAVVAIESLLINALAIALYPHRGVLRHLRDVLLYAAVLGFVFLFIVLTYGAAQGLEGTGPFELAGCEVDAAVLGWAVVFAAAHQAVMVVYAYATPQPRRTWARLALLQGSITFPALFLTVPVVMMAGPLVLDAVGSLAPGAAAADILLVLAISVRLGLALTMGRLPDETLDRISKNPYTD